MEKIYGRGRRSGNRGSSVTSSSLGNKDIYEKALRDL